MIVGELVLLPLAFLLTTLLVMMSTFCRIFFVLGLVATGLGWPSLTHAQDAFIGSWTGTLEAGPTSLRIVFHIDRAEGGLLSASMDSPDQGATGIPVSRVVTEGDSLTLAVDRINGRFDGTLAARDSTIEGTWTQGGQSFPLTLSPADASNVALPPRPQHPEPPYPYATEEVTFHNEADDLTLAGTLTRPERDGPHPAVVLISGSGPQDRNSEVFGHKLFLVLADHLTRHGLAVLRYDERGVGDSGGSFEGATSEDLARDGATAVRFLKRHPDIEERAIGILGMSEGGIVAPMIHIALEDAAFLVLIAGPSVPGHELLVEQSAQITAVQGAPAAAVDSIRKMQRRTVEAIRTAPDSAAAAARLRTILAEQDATDDQIQSQIEQATSPWFQYFIRYDPEPMLRQIDIPVLALYGSKDLQVPPEQNAAPMRTALAESPSDDVTVRVLDGLNHLFQPADTGLPGEYAQVETTMAPDALQAVTEWIRARTSAGK